MKTLGHLTEQTNVQYMIEGLYQLARGNVDAREPIGSVPWRGASIPLGPSYSSILNFKSF
jgi:hypothetical protein